MCIRDRRVATLIHRNVLLYTLCLLSSLAYIRNILQSHFIHSRVQLYFFRGIVQRSTKTELAILRSELFNTKEQLRKLLVSLKKKRRVSATYKPRTITTTTTTTTTNTTKLTTTTTKKLLHLQ